MKRFLMAVFLVAFYLPAWAAEEVDGSNLTADVNACDYEPAKGKLYKTKTGRTLDCRRYYVMSLYGYQGGEGNVSMGMNPEAMCQGTIYYCEYIGRGKFKRSPINLSYVGNQCKGDNKLISVRFEAVNGSYAASKRLASSRLSHQCPDEEKPKPDDDKKPKPDDDKKPKPDDDKKPKPDDDKKPKPDDDKKPKPDDDKKPKPDDDKKPKPDDGNNPDKSMEDLLRRINDSLDRLNKNIEKSGSGSGGSGNGGGGHGSGNGGSGNGGGGHGSGNGGSGNGGGGHGSGNGGSGNGGGGHGSGGSGGGNGSGSGNGNGNGNGDHSGDGYSPPKDPDWGRLGGVKAPRYSKDGRFSEVGVCPKPVTFNLTVLRLSQTFAFSYEHVCDLAVRMRPILIACAYFAAGLICLAALER